GRSGTSSARSVRSFKHQAICCSSSIFSGRSNTVPPPATIRGTPGLWNGPQRRRRRLTTSKKCPPSAAAARFGIPNIQTIPIGSTNNMETTIANAVEVPPELRYNHVKVGMLAFLTSEVAFFSLLISTYVVFLHETKTGSPNPAEVFHLPLVLVGTACLL